jgi:hypothetical protein
MAFGDFFNPPAANINLPTPQTLNLPFPSAAPSQPFPSVPSIGGLSYQPTGVAGAESSLLGGIGALSGFNQYPGILPQAQTITGGITGFDTSPFAGGAQTGASLGQQAATNQFDLARNLYGYGNRLFDLGFDPQSALYSRTLQQIQDQARAAQGVRGIATSPFGAGLENQAVGNFNIDWNNQALQRALAGAGGAGALYGQAAGMQAGAGPMFLSASGMPFQEASSVAGTQLGTLGTLGQLGAAGGQQALQPLGALQNYLGWSTPQMGQFAQLPFQQFGAGLQGQGQAFGQGQNVFSDALAQAQQNWTMQQQLADLKLQQDKQAAAEQSSMFSGIGALGGGLLGWMGGGPIGGLAGAKIGSSL